MKMEAELNGPASRYSYQLVDIRELDGERLLDSPSVGDNMVAILTRLRDPTAAVHRVVERIANLPHAQRKEALARLAILAGLRRLDDVLEEEVGKMPITEDITTNRFYQKAMERGRQEGVQIGELSLLRRMIEKRFGPIPAWAEERLNGLSLPQLEDLGERLLDASSLEQLLPR
jgi:predicted transposase YdaD